MTYARTSENRSEKIRPKAHVKGENRKKLSFKRGKGNRAEPTPRERTGGGKVTGRTGSMGGKDAETARWGPNGQYQYQDRFQKKT